MRDFLWLGLGDEEESFGRVGYGMSNLLGLCSSYDKSIFGLSIQLAPTPLLHTFVKPKLLLI